LLTFLNVKDVQNIHGDATIIIGQFMKEEEQEEDDEICV
jgi:hypothetical protein